MTDQEINQKIARYIFEIEDLDYEDVVTLGTVEETTIQVGYCETCFYETQAMRVTYTDTAGKYHEITSYMDYSGCLQAILKEL